MTSGSPIRTLTLAALLAICLHAPAWSATQDDAAVNDADPAEQRVDELIARLAKPAPATISFTEVRFSKLLKAPLIVSGDLGYSGPESLDRRVTTPYREHTAIRGESVKVERDGEKPRSFALKHAPELRGLLSGFSAMLLGDAAALRKAFDVELSGDDDAWTLKLVPPDKQRGRRLRQIEVNGKHSEPRCFTMSLADGGSSVLLLGNATMEPIAPDVTPVALQRRCAE